MIIKISNLSEGIHNFEFIENACDIDLEEPFFGKVGVKTELNKIHNQIILQADITVEAKFNCDRCTAEFESVLKSSYKMVYLFSSEYENNDDISVTFLSPEADKIILDNDVRDYALLSVPMKKLCKTECRGLCPRCGKDLNVEQCSCNKEVIDERWLPLMELKNKLNTN